MEGILKRLSEIKRHSIPCLLATICLSKSLKDLSDYLNFFGSYERGSQLSPAIFKASRNHPVENKNGAVKTKPVHVTPNSKCNRPITYQFMLIVDGFGGTAERDWISHH
eukprot:UN20613